MDNILAVMNKGVRCGNHGGAKFYHPNSDAVRECYAETAHDELMNRIEREAEAGYERHLEDRGYEAARAQEAHDLAHGIY